MNLLMKKAVRVLLWGCAGVALLVGLLLIGGSLWLYSFWGGAEMPAYRPGGASANELLPSQPEVSSTPATWFLPSGFLSRNRKQIEPEDPALAEVTRRAQARFPVSPYSPTQKTKLPPSGDPHDFYTISPYFWPNSLTASGLPYIFRDGRINPEAKSDAYDRTRYFELNMALRHLSLAYYFTQDERYAEKAVGLLRAWFLDPETRMNPHFRHSQAIPGILPGFSLGVIRGTELVQMLDSAALLEGSPHWTPDFQRQLAAWFRDYHKWVRTHPYGQREYRMKNNHGTWFDAHVVAVALYVGDVSSARDILSRIAKVRIDEQIAPDGRQPHEIKRSRSWYYSTYNLLGLFTLAQLAERVDLDLWNYEGPEGQSLRKALDYLIDHREKWPHPGYRKEPHRDLYLLPLLALAAGHYDDPRYSEALKTLPLSEELKAEPLNLIYGFIPEDVTQD